MGETGKKAFDEIRWRAAAHYMMGLRRHAGRRDEQEYEHGCTQYPAGHIFLVHDMFSQA